MLIWDIIRDWFVMNIWGGYTKQGVFYETNAGMLESYINGVQDDRWLGGCHEITFRVGSYNGADLYMCLPDWLSTMSTIIVLIAVCVALYFLVRYFFRMFAGLLSGR